MAILYTNDLKNDLETDAVSQATKALYNLYTSYKNLSERPILQSRAYETYATVRQVLTPFFQRFWVCSYELGTENIPGIDERDIVDTINAIIDRWHWKDITPRRLRHLLAQSLMTRGQYPPWFNGLPCTGKGCYRGIREDDDGNSIPCPHCNGTGCEPNPSTGELVDRV